MKTLSLLGASALLTGCVFTPKVVTRYDACDIEVRQMVLTAQQTGLLYGLTRCGGDDCVGQLAAEVLLVPVSAVISGSIVLVGNTVFWMQQRGQCQTATRETSAVDLGPVMLARVEQPRRHPLQP